MVLLGVIPGWMGGGLVLEHVVDVRSEGFGVVDLLDGLDLPVGGLLLIRRRLS